MSKADTSSTSVLLPAARVHLFTRDEASKNTFLGLKNDWRFARVALDAYEGDVDTAVQTYADSASPDLVIMQTETIDESFTGRLESLSAYCNENTRAIVIGPVNDVNLYRRLVGMGVSDYLVKPLETEALGNDIAATLLEQLGASSSKLIVFLGVKGGVGATVLSEAAAWCMSEKYGQKTFLLDAAGGWSTLSVGMGFEPAATLSEALRAIAEDNEDSFSRMVHNPGDKLSLLSSGGDPMLDGVADPEAYEMLLEHLMTTYPLILADMSGASPMLKKAVVARAHRVLLITTPVLPAVRATRTLMQEIRDIRGSSDDAVSLILNMQGFAPKHEVPKAQIEEGLERKMDAVIPFDPGLYVAVESEGRKLHADKAGEAVATKLAPLILNTGNQNEEQGDKKGKIPNFLTKLKTRN